MLRNLVEHLLLGKLQAGLQDRGGQFLGFSRTAEFAEHPGLVEVDDFAAQRLVRGNGFAQFPQCNSAAFQSGLAKS